MKTLEPKSIVSQAQKKAPFFSKDVNGKFFRASAEEKFFPKNEAIQEKLIVGEPDDRYEKEADEMAEKVVQRSAKPDIKDKKIEGVQAKLLAGSVAPVIQSKPAPAEEGVQMKEEDLAPEGQLDVQRKPIFESGDEKPPDDESNIQKKCQDCEREEKLHTKPNTDNASQPTSDIEGHLSSSKGQGSTLPDSTRAQMENSLGADFSQVRMHTDSTAVHMNQALHAQAFTHGKDVYFNSGKYNPANTEGKKLLAHELTHTVQQGEAVRRKGSANSTNQKVTATEEIAPMSSEVVDISGGQFLPSEKVKMEIEEAKGKGLDVRVIVPNISEEGKIKIRLDSRGNYQAVQGQKGYMPVKNAWANQIGGLYLRFTVKNNEVKGGFVSPNQKGGNPNDWIKKIKENSALLGGLGLKIKKLPNPVNEFNANSFRIGFTEGQIEVGGIVDANFNFSLENGEKPKIDGVADVNVKGVAKGQLMLDNTKEKLTGEVSLAIEFKDFTGNVTAKYNEDGSIDIRGKGAYNANKLSGEINFVSTDTQSANNFAKDAIKEAGGKENVQNATPPAAAPLPKEGKKDRALAAVGTLQFNLTDWFAGTVNVIVDGKGDVTVIGRIAPPAEVELFKQKDFDKEIISLKVEAGYGIPVVGTIGVFAGVSLSAVAYIGPAKLYNIEILGTYSTDPEVQKNIQISGSINISAYAGLRLRAEGGAKLTILSHDLKLGVGVNADVGVKAYADARPTIGYRDPGEFYISGTAQLVAQPMLGLSGDFFIEIDTPWWSPIDDDRWVWPIGSMEWPLSDPIGLNATMKDYVLGSGTAPDITFEKPEFDASKFLTKMVDKELPDKSGPDKGGKGEFKEDGTVVKPEVPDPNAKKEEPGAEAKPGKEPSKLKDKKKKAIPDAKAQQEAAVLFQEGAKKLEAVKGPLSKGDLRKALDGIEKSVAGIKYHIALDGAQWKVTASAKGVDNSKPFKVSAIVTEEDKKVEAQEGKTDAIAEPLQFKEKFDTETGISHTIYILNSEGTPELIIESAPMNVLSFFNQKELEIKNSTTIEKAEKARKLNRIRHGKNLLQGVEALMNSTKATNNNNPRIPGMIREIILVVRETEPGGATQVVPQAEFSPGFSNVKASSFSARYLYKGSSVPGGVTIPQNHADGGPPTDRNLPGAWQILQDMQLSRRWVKFHILNETLGGIAADSNLIPTPTYYNNEYKAELETDLKSYYSSGLPIWISATVTYRSGYNSLFVDHFSARAGAMKYQANHWIEDPTKQRSFSKQVDMPQSSAFNINRVISDASDETLLVNMSTMTRGMVDILRDRQPSGGYTYYRQMERALASEVFGRDILSFDPEVIRAQSPTNAQVNTINGYRVGLSSVNWSF